MTRRGRSRAAPRRTERVRSAQAESPGRSTDPAQSGPKPFTLRHPASLAAHLVAALAVLLSVSYRIDDPDVWQHLLVGKAIWQAHAVPTTHLWTWPGYGAPEVLLSWGFRAALWPFWTAGEVWGLFVWRWVTVLATFAILWAAARAMGARGLATLVVLVLAGLTFRLRSQVRPETLVAILLALQIWLLESRRRGIGRGHGFGLVAVAWVWANVHISYWVGFMLTGIHLLDGLLGGTGATRPQDRPRGKQLPAGAVAPRSRPGVLSLAGVMLATVAVSLVNPFTWHGLWQPFEYFLHWRHEPIYQTIGELQPLTWSTHWRSGLPLLMAGWSVLIIWRTLSDGPDWAEILTCGAFSALAWSAQRHAGFYALVAAPYVARDLEAWIGTRRWPAWTRPPGIQSGLASVACVAAGLLEWTRPVYPLGVGFEMNQYPIKACDFMEANGIKGRGFNSYYLGGYQAWRFWPERERLPFMDAEQSGTPEDRNLYAYVFANRDAWRELDRRHSFDYVLLDGHQETVVGDRLLDFLDADSTWALVFRDDAAALYVRVQGSLGQLAERSGYALVPGGMERIPALIRLCEGNPRARLAARHELERQLAASPYNARAHSLLATLDWIEGGRASARAHLEQALRTDARALGIHQRLGQVALSEGRPAEAARLFEAERALGYAPQGLEFMLGQAYGRAGNLSRARSAYRRELSHHPENAAARESLAVLEGRGGR